MEIKAEIRAIAQNKKSEDEDGEDTSPPIVGEEEHRPNRCLLDGRTGEQAHRVPNLKSCCTWKTTLHQRLSRSGRSGTSHLSGHPSGHGWG